MQKQIKIKSKLNGMNTQERLIALFPVPNHFEQLKTGDYDNEVIEKIVKQIMTTADKYLESDEIELVKPNFNDGNLFDTFNSITAHQGVNSSHHILPLVEAFFLTDNQKYADKAISIIPRYLELKWSENGRASLSLAFWWEGLLPAISYLLQSDNIVIKKETEVLISGLKEKFIVSAEWLEGYVKKTKFGNNHLTVAAIGLAEVGLLLGNDNDNRYFKTGYDVFMNHLFVSCKLGQEGTWYEDSVAFHSLVIRHTIHFLTMLKSAEIADLFKEPKVRNIFNSYFQYSTPNGTFCDFNDSATDSISARDLHILAFGASEYQSSELEFLFRRGYNYQGTTRIAPASQILRYYDVRKNIKPEIPKQPLDKKVKHIDQIFSRSSWGNDANYIAIESGIILPHSHFDRGTFTLYYKGQPIMVDTGKGQPYSLHDKRSEMYADRHNTSFAGTGYRINSEDKGIQPFDAVTKEYLACDSMCYAEIDTTGLATCANATRKIFFSKTGYVLIIDELEDDTDRDYHQVFHGVGEFKIANNIPTWNNGNGITTEVYVRSSQDISFETGTHDVYGRKNIIEQKFIDVQTSGKKTMYISCVFPKTEDEDGSVDIIKRNNFYEVKIIKNDIEDSFIIKEDVKLLKYKDFQTDCRISWLREINGKMIAYGVVDGWEYFYKNQCLLTDENSEIHRKIAPKRKHNCLIDLHKL